MADPKLLEAWYRFMAEAVRETSDAQAFFEKYARGQSPAEWVARWMQQTGAADAPPAPADRPDDWMEQWYTMMGVVPRARYLKLLERHEQLRQDLEAARKTIERLGGSFDRGASGESAEDFMNLWTSTLDKTLEAQAEWMRSFSESAPSDEGDEAADEGDEAADEEAGPASDDAEPPDDAPPS